MHNSQIQDKVIFSRSLLSRKQLWEEQISTAIQVLPMPVPTPKKFRSMKGLPENRPQRVGTINTIIDPQKGILFL